MSVLQKPATCIVACFVCGTPLDNISSRDVNQPNDGLEFTSHGHYGSTAFDPVTSPEHLVINICDDCVRRAAEKGRIAVRFPSEPLRLWQVEE